MSGVNVPDKREAFTLDEGEAMVEVIEDTKIPNAATIKIVKQDHTLGNMLRAQLLSMPQILFAGYKVPHPLHPYFHIKIQTDGSVTPQEVLEQACTRLIAMMGTLENKFKREFRLGETDGPGTANIDLGMNDPYGAGGVGAWGANPGGGEYEDF